MKKSKPQNSIYVLNDKNRTILKKFIQYENENPEAENIRLFINLALEALSAYYILARSDNSGKNENEAIKNLVTTLKSRSYELGPGVFFSCLRGIKNYLNSHDFPFPMNVAYSFLWFTLVRKSDLLKKTNKKLDALMKRVKKSTAKIFSSPVESANMFAKYTYPLFWFYLFVSVDALNKPLKKGNINYDVDSCNMESDIPFIREIVTEDTQGTIRSFLDFEYIDVNLSNNKCRETLPTTIITEFQRNKVDKLLLTHKEINVDLRNKKDNETPFMLVPVSDDANLSNLLLADESIDINQQNKQTALIVAAAEGYFHVVQKLLSMKNVEINKQDQDGNTALLMAIVNGHFDSANLLLDKEAIEINQQNKYGQTALIVAAVKGYSHVVQKLLSMKNVEINKQDQDGSTALIVATTNNYFSLTRLLLDKETIDINIHNNHGLTALIIAAANGYLTIVQQLLSKKSVEIDKPDKNGRTALMYATVRKHIKIAEEFLKSGTNVYAKSKDGNTALDIARYDKNQELVILLSLYYKKDIRQDEAHLGFFRPQNNKKKRIENDIIPEELKKTSLSRSSSSSQEDKKLVAKFEITVFVFIIGAIVFWRITKRSTSRAAQNLNKEALKSNPKFPKLLPTEKKEVETTSLLFNISRNLTTEQLAEVNFLFKKISQVVSLLSGLRNRCKKQDEKNHPRNFLAPHQATTRKSSRASTNENSTPDNNKKITLVEACQKGDLSQVKLYLAQKTDLTQVEIDLTPLQAACFYNQYLVVALFCDEKGLAANRENAQGETALSLAVKKDYWNVVKLLLKHKDKLELEINANNPHSDTLLNLAVENLPLSSLKELLQIYPEHNKGEFLLRFLSQSEKSSIKEKDLNEFVFDYIIDHKAEITPFKSKTQLTPLMLACQLGYRHVVEYLVDANVNIHLTDASGKSALYHAAEQATKLFDTDRHHKTFINIIKFLLEKGARLNVRENGDSSPSRLIEALILKLRSGITRPVLQKSQRDAKSQMKQKIKPKQKSETNQDSAQEFQARCLARNQGEKKAEKEEKKQISSSQKKQPTAKSDSEQKRNPLSKTVSTPVKSEPVNHQSWADLIVDYIVRLGVTFYQEGESKEDKEFSPEQQAFHIYMQHSLCVYYLHRLLFALTCYGRHIQREFKLIDSGEIHHMLTKRGTKSLCQFLSYETYNAVFATTEKIVKELPKNMLKGLKKPHELQTALKPQNRLAIASLFKLVEESKAVRTLQPVGQLFIQDTPLHKILTSFHLSLTQNTNVVNDHFTLVKYFFLPTIQYVYLFLVKEPNSKRQTDQVLLKGTLDYTKIENYYQNYLDLLVLLYSLCGETLLARQHPKDMKTFVKRCRDEIRNEIAHEAKVIFRADFLLNLGQQACQLVRKKINWQEVVSMPDTPILLREEIRKGLSSIKYYDFFNSAPSKPIDIIIDYAKPSFAC